MADRIADLSKIDDNADEILIDPEAYANEAFDQVEDIVDVTDSFERQRNSENLLSTVIWTKKAKGRSLSLISDDLALKARMFRTKAMLKVRVIQVRSVLGSRHTVNDKL